jgi:hypothetical protein
MDFKIIWSDAAIADLQDIWTFIAQHDAVRRLESGVTYSRTFEFWQTFHILDHLIPTAPRLARCVARNRGASVSHFL